MAKLSRTRETATATRTAAQAAVAQLVAEGVEVVFGIPGGHNLELCDAVLDHPQLRFLTGRSEQEIAFMADGYSRAGGRIAVPLAITGPGVANCLTPILDAYADSVPLVIVAGQVARAYRGRGAFHEVKDQTEMVRSATKWNICVERAEEVPAAIREAFVQAFQGRPGPVLVEIPVDVQSEKADIPGLEPVPVEPEAADPADLDRAARLLLESRFPIVYAGHGAILSGCGQELLRLVERLQAPCFTTPQAKGIVPEDHPLSLGWGWVERGPARAFLEKADAALVVGSSLDEVDTGGWTLPFPQNLIQIDSSPRMIGRNYPVAAGLIGDARTALLQLLQLLPEQRRSSSPALDIREMKSRLLARLEPTPGYRLVEAIQQALPEDGLVFNDSCIGNGWLMAHLTRRVPRTFHITRSMAALGFALPAALGAKLACPDRQVVAAVGDGGLLFTDCALATAVQYRLNVAVLVFNNRSYGSIRNKQERLFGRCIGVTLHNPDFPALARSYGAAGCRVEEPGQLEEALRAAWAREVPTLIEIPVEMGSDYF